MPSNRPSRHGKHRIPVKDSDFDQYIRTTTEYLLQQSTVPYKKKDTWWHREKERIYQEKKAKEKQNENKSNPEMNSGAEAIDETGGKD